MSEEFGPSFISLTDEDGNEFELEYVDAMEYNGQTYMAFLPVINEDEEVNEEEYGVLILKSQVVDGEEILVTIEDDEELDAVYELFAKDLFDDEEEE